MLSKQNVGRAFESLRSWSADAGIATDDDEPIKIHPDAFRSLVSVMLSAQTQDVKTAMASDKLFAVADTPKEILALDDAVLIELIRDVGLYNVKARNIKAMCRNLLDRHDGVVPSDRATMMALTGVGRKSADIVLRFVFGQPVVAVDTHVHRLCNRLGLASGKTEAQTARNLEERIPKKFRMPAHMWLVEYGRRICKARNPQCEACHLSGVCERNGVAR